MAEGWELCIRIHKCIVYMVYVGLEVFVYALNVIWAIQGNHEIRTVNRIP